MPSTSPAAIEIRELSHPGDLAQLVRVFDDVWRPDPTNRPASTDMLRALAHAGNYVVGAYIGGQLAGGSVGFFAAPVGDVLHSHMTGVSRLGRGHSVGYALKMHQRDWALARGLSAITWTFDPLVARNAYFNLAKLGAAPVEYHRDFYGVIGDELAGEDETDRMLLRWSLVDGSMVPDTSHSAADLVAGGAILAIDDADPAHPVPVTEPIPDEATVVVPVPRDIEGLRRESPIVASRWRRASAGVFAQLAVVDKLRPTAFLRSGQYVFGPAAPTHQRAHRP